jgi:uncharacterized protein (DUF427 family)
MSTRAPLIPGPDHPITIEPSSAHVVVKAGSAVIADSSNALALHEASYPPVYYVPLADVDSELLESSDTTSYCPYKGDASYYSVRTGDSVVKDAIWFYDEPYDAVSEIAGHVAFYADRVQIEDSTD